MALIRIPRSIENNFLLAVLKVLIGNNDIAYNEMLPALQKVKVINILRVVVDPKKTTVTVYINRKKIHSYSGFVKLPRSSPEVMLELMNTTIPKEIVTSSTFDCADTVLSRQGGGFWTFSGK